MAQAPHRWGPYPLADPIWWAEQQLKVVTATTTYLTRVTRAVTAVAAPQATGTRPAPATAVEPSAPAAGEPALPAVIDKPALPAVIDEPALPAVVDEAAPPAVLDEPAGLAETEPAVTAAGEELPVARWDELSLGSIRARLSRLSESDLVTLHAYEERHGGRPDVLSMLANRLIRIRQAGGPAGSAG